MLKSLFKHMRSASRARDAAPVARESGAELIRQGRLDEAAEVFREACTLQPHDAGAWHAFGYALSLRGKYPEAIDALCRAVGIAPQQVETLYNLASAYRSNKEDARAIETFQRVAALRPEWYAPWVSLGDLYARQGAFDTADDMYRRALALAPDVSEIHSNFSKVLMECGSVEEGIARYRSALELKPTFAPLYSSYLSALQYSDAHTAEEIRDAHFEFDVRYAKTLAPAVPPRRVHLRDRPLRIGYVSPDFRQHAVAALVEPAIKHHDRQRFPVYCYANVRAPDSRTDRFRGYAAGWRDISALSDDAAAELIRRDEIDILVDLAGHTNDHRLLVFARKPAPVQITWIGHPNTTGMSAMDYRITDAYADPPGRTEHLHSERLLRLPDIYLPFEAPDHATSVSVPPCLSRGFVTFGSYNSFLKVKPRTIAVWSRILHEVPGSRLMIVTVAEGRTRERLKAAFAEHGISADRLDLRGRLAHADFLQACADADIALDTYPYHGTTTTAHTLWMGLPVITLAGSTHLSRVGVSMLSNVGLAELIASDDDEYVALAARLAADLGKLRELRAGLRGRMEKAPNMDGPRFARALEAAFTMVWEEYCKQHR